jgi:hypothetical protein
VTHGQRLLCVSGWRTTRGDRAGEQRDASDKQDDSSAGV